MVVKLGMRLVNKLALVYKLSSDSGKIRNAPVGLNKHDTA